MNKLTSIREIPISKLGPNELSIQDYILNNLDEIGLGNLSIIAVEKRQKFKSRIDALIMKDDSEVRYILDVTIGTRDSSKIETFYSYCEFEKEQNPQFKYCAIIFAEKITTPFSEAIKIFNGVVPLIAFEVSAYESKSGDQFITFNKVIDSFTDGFIDYDHYDYYKNNGSDNKVKTIYSDRYERKIPTGFKLEKEHYTWNKEQGYYVMDRSTDLIEVIDYEMIDMLLKENSITLDEE